MLLLPTLGREGLIAFGWVRCEGDATDERLINDIFFIAAEWCCEEACYAKLDGKSDKEANQVFDKCIHNAMRKRVPNVKCTAEM